MSDVNICMSVPGASHTWLTWVNGWGVSNTMFRKQAEVKALKPPTWSRTFIIYTLLFHTQSLLSSRLSLNWVPVYLLKLGGKGERWVSYFLLDSDCTLSIIHRGDGKKKEEEIMGRRRQKTCGGHCLVVPVLLGSCSPDWGCSKCHAGLFIMVYPYYLVMVYFITCCSNLHRIFSSCSSFFTKALWLWFQEQPISSYQGVILEVFCLKNTILATLSCVFANQGGIESEAHCMHFRHSHIL